MSGAKGQGAPSQQGRTVFSLIELVFTTWESMKPFNKIINMLSFSTPRTANGKQFSLQQNIFEGYGISNYALTAFAGTSMVAMVGWWLVILATSLR